MTGTHDNRAVWDGQYAVNECFAESVRDNGWMTIGRRVECEDYAWAQRVNAPDARGLCSALADALGVELHPAGTFDPCSQSYPLTARGREVLAAIDACRVTEAEAEPDPDIPYLPTWAISSLLHLLWIDDENLPDAYLHRQVAAELKSKGLIRLTRYEHYALTPTGRALAKRFLANMRRKPPEPEPIGYSLRALLGLAWEYVHDARAGSSFLDAARAEGLLVGTYGERKPTDLGRKTWTDFLRRLGLPGDGSKPEPPAEVWSEPIAQMGLLRCEEISRMLGYGDPQTLPTDASGIGWEGSCTLNGEPLKGQWQAYRGKAAQAIVRDCANNQDRYDAATDRVRLTGLEPQQ